MTESGQPFSLLLPVYHADRAAHFLRAFQSAVTDQTRTPAEVVLVQDGPVPDGLARAIRSVVQSSLVPVNLVVLHKNVGLAKALTMGLAACKNEFIARMDADDISLPQRFERQIPLLESGYDLVGSGMLEFDEDGKVWGRRVPPSGAETIARSARFKDPFNHPTVVYRKSAVLDAGGYRELRLMEDYWLFARMIQHGARAENLTDPLVMYRIDAGAYHRRGGWKLFSSEVQLQVVLRRERFTSLAQFIRNVVVRGGYRFVPTTVRRLVYRKISVRKVSPND
ncbi:glycosyltransferase [Rathayibacter sp. KR2-224]|uniref:glycosyltransferase n=1 Tax=Rathayibacter sp. KR2-224 TaxID=3400913 RepID=UPI003C06FD95